MDEAPTNQPPSATSATGAAERAMLPQSAGEWLMLCLVGLVGLVLRLSVLDAPLWIDELHTSWVVADDLGSVAARASAGNQPPAFFWLVWGITQVTSHNAFSLRLVSMLAGMGSIAVVYGLTRQWTSSHLAGIATALLVATDRNMIFYASEGRSYAVVQLVGLLQLGSVWAAIHQQSRRRIPLHLLIVTTSVLLVYLHFTTALLLAVEGVLLLALGVLRRLPREAALWLLADACLVLVSLIPLHESFLDVVQRKENWRPYVSQSHWITNYIWALRLPCYLIIPLAVAILSRLRRQAMRTLPTTDWGLVGFVCLWSLLPLVLMGISGMALQPVLIKRFATISLFGPIVLCGLSIAHLRAPRWQLVAMTLAVGVSLWQSGMVAQLRSSGKLIVDKREYWGDAMEHIQRDHLRGDGALVHAGLIEASQYANGTAIERAYCLLPVSGIYSLPPALAAQATPLTGIGSAASLNTIRAAAGQHERVWLLLRIRSDQADRFSDQLRSGGLDVIQHVPFDGVQTFLVQQAGTSNHG